MRERLGRAGRATFGIALAAAVLAGCKPAVDADAEQRTFSGTTYLYSDPGVKHECFTSTERTTVTIQDRHLVNLNGLLAEVGQVDTEPFGAEAVQACGGTAYTIINNGGVPKHG